MRFHRLCKALDSGYKSTILTSFHFHAWNPPSNYKVDSAHKQQGMHSLRSKLSPTLSFDSQLRVSTHKSRHKMYETQFVLMQMY